MRHTLTLIVTAAAFALASTCFAADRPNIILCMADDQGFGDVGYNSDGRLKTPVLDEMARSGLRLDRFYAAAPVCSPTRGSVMTGRHPNRFGCFQWGHTLRPQEITIAEALKQAGYRTGHFGKWHLGSARADSPVSPGNSGFDTWVSSPNFFDNDPYLSHGGKVVKHEGESSMVTVEQALNFIREASKGGASGAPFLAVIWFGSPHSPHEGSPELMELYKDLPPREAAYAAEVTGIDRAMGRLRQELRDLGIADNTIVWYTSDNGAQGGNNGLGSTGPFSGRKGDLLEGGIRVPAIIEWPAVVKSARATDALAGTIDIFPTVADIAGAKVPADRPMDGVSIRPLIEGAHFQRNKPMGFWDFPQPGVRSPSTELLVEQLEGKPTEYNDAAMATTIKPHPADFREGEAAWIDGDWKLLRRPAAAAGNAAKAKKAKANANARSGVSLYNLKQDPAEENDLAASEPQRLKQMTAALEQWQASVIHSLNGGDY